MGKRSHKRDRPTRRTRPPHRRPTDRPPLAVASHADAEDLMLRALAKLAARGVLDPADLEHSGLEPDQWRALVDAMDEAADERAELLSGPHRDERLRRAIIEEQILEMVRQLEAEDAATDPAHVPGQVNVDHGWLAVELSKALRFEVSEAEVAAAFEVLVDDGQLLPWPPQDTEHEPVDLG